MGDAGGELAERSEFLGLHQAILRGAQLIERERQFPGPLLNLAKQSRILDRDDGLVGKGSDQIDLLVGEWPHLGAGHGQYTNRRAITQHWNAQHGPKATKFLGGVVLVFGIEQDIGNADNPSLTSSTSDKCTSIRHNGAL